jgi:predicted MFS family arabinose efflux permease
MSPALPPAAPPSSPHTPGRGWRIDTFRALAHRNYRLYFFGQAVSLTGTWVQSAALTWLAWELTRQNSWTALVSAAQVVPTVALGVYGGGLADRWPRRPLIFATQFAFLLFALLLTGLVGFDAVTPWGLLAVSLAVGVVNAVDTPTRLAFVCDMVGRDDLLNAIALNSLVFNVARAVGPALGGWVDRAAQAAAPAVGLAPSPRLGAAACFLFNALSFVAVLVALACMRLPPRPRVVAARRNAGSVAEAFRHLARRPALVLLLILACATAFFGWPLISLLPALSDHQLHAGREGYDHMLSAVGAGALVGALLVASFGSAARQTLLLGAGIVLEAAALLGLATTTDVAAAVACCALSGAGLILFFATGQAMMQLGAGEHNRGRVMGVWLTVLSAAQPLGHLLGGRVADAWGVPPVLLLQGAGIALAAAAVGAAALLKRKAV